MNLSNLKRLIVLEGFGNSGKTTTLNQVYNKLKHSFPQNRPLIDETFKSNDHLLVMRGKSGRLTAIHTAGDSANSVVKSFGIAEKQQCEVLVMAVSIPVKPSTIPLAKIAFEEIVKANALQYSLHKSQRLKPQSAQRAMANQLSNAIWQQM